MHAQHGGSAVNDFAAPISHHEGNGSAAALVHLAQFANLPRYTPSLKI